MIGTSYTHTSPDNDSNYYWITSCNSSGCSDIDSSKPAQFIDSRPLAPGNVQVSREGESLRIDWDSSADATHYKVYFSDFFDSECKLGHSGSPVFCEELAGNVIGTTYMHTGQSAQSPRKPSIRVIDRTSDSLTVRLVDFSDTNHYWVTACNSGGCSDLDNQNATSYKFGTQYYELHRSLAREGEYSLLDSRLTSSRYVDEGLQPGTVYYYRVRGCNDNSCSAPAITGGLTESDGAVDVPAIPDGVKGEKIRIRFWPDHAAVTWNAVEGATFFEVYQGSDLDAEVSAPQVRYTDFSPNRFHGAFQSTSYKVRACNKAGCSEFSETVWVQ